MIATPVSISVDQYLVYRQVIDLHEWDGETIDWPWDLIAVVPPSENPFVWHDHFGKDQRGSVSYRVTPIMRVGGGYLAPAPDLFPEVSLDDRFVGVRLTLP